MKSLSNLLAAARVMLKRLLYRHSVSIAQAGQDYWIYAEAFDEQRGGYFVDVGAFDGLSVSNTYLLEKRYGWRGLCVEADPDIYARLLKNRSCTCLNVCIDRTEGEVEFGFREELSGIAGLDNPGEWPVTRTLRLKTRPLLSVLREHNAPSVIDYLSIDIEGAEERVLADFDFSAYRFNTITIERPTERLRGILAAAGYRLMREVPGLDCLYVHEQFHGTYMRNFYYFHRKRHLQWRWRLGPR